MAFSPLGDVETQQPTKGDTTMKQSRTPIRDFLNLTPAEQDAANKQTWTHAISEASCHTCRRALSASEVKLGDGNCLRCFEKAETIDF
jgi:hypothetical protein